MHGEELSALINERRSILAQLLEVGNRQIDVIAAGRMSELMRILAEKQIPLERLAEISTRLREAADDDARKRQWPNEQARRQCRQAQEECEQMHIELLAMEAQCETALSTSRDALQRELHQIDSAHQAANGYAHATPTAGVRLDLSSD